MVRWPLDAAIVAHEREPGRRRLIIGASHFAISRWTWSTAWHNGWLKNSHLFSSCRFKTSNRPPFAALKLILSQDAGGLHSSSYRWPYFRLAASLIADRHLGENGYAQRSRKWVGKLERVAHLNVPYIRLKKESTTCLLINNSPLKRSSPAIHW